jgi:hypothetical protein
MSAWNVKHLGGILSEMSHLARNFETGGQTLKRIPEIEIKVGEKKR